MKALIIGLGGIGQRHVRNLRSLLQEGVEFVAYRVRGLKHVVTAKLEADATRNVEESLGVRSFYDLGRALEEKPDIAFICNPTSSHIPVAIACVKAGCDLFVEKPLSHSIDSVEELIQAVDHAKRIAMVGYQLRFHPCVTKLASVIRSGCLGHLLSVRAAIGECLPNWHPYEDYRQSYAGKANLGGGVILTQIHEFDYLYSLFGLPSKVFAIGGQWSDLEIDVEDTASILMECSFESHPLPIHVHQDYVQSPGTRHCEVIGDRGKAILDFPSLSVTVQDFRSTEPTVYAFPGFDRNLMFIDEARHFLTCVQDRSRPIVDLRDGLQSLRMALAAKESIATGKPIALSTLIPEFAKA